MECARFLLAKHRLGWGVKIPLAMDKELEDDVTAGGFQHAFKPDGCAQIIQQTRAMRMAKQVPTAAPTRPCRHPPRARAASRRSTSPPSRAKTWWCIRRDAWRTPRPTKCPTPKWPTPKRPTPKCPSPTRFRVLMCRGRRGG